MNIKRNGKMKIKSILFVSVLTMSANVNAATYSFSVDSFQMAGNLPVSVVDDFNNGSIAPLWEVFDPTVVESGGTVTFSNPGTTVSSLQIGGLSNISSEMSYIGSTSPGQLQMQNGAGSFLGTSTWISATPNTNQFFTMIISNIVADEDISIFVSNYDSVFANAFGVPQGLSITFGRFKDVATGDFNVQGVSILPGDITGDILLSLAFDDTTDLFQGAYSLDGGTTFLSPFSAIAASSTVQEMGWNLGAESFTVVPLPSAVWLFGSGLIGLIGIARRKTTLKSQESIFN